MAEHKLKQRIEPEDDIERNLAERVSCFSRRPFASFTASAPQEWRFVRKWPELSLATEERLMCFSISTQRKVGWFLSRTAGQTTESVTTVKYGRYVNIATSAATGKDPTRKRPIWCCHFFSFACTLKREQTQKDDRKQLRA